ncbi:hypothetical protein NM688_g4381 [Phlebia brevispora]|uniref:Uncharacterized protein n=1 Tax=Phlebia brevispora TaxID=194682 RepID=A0ACC1T2T3_9APHY|nr:hypothetical protein NM688_g4381 [Phlebia brevispora]
MQAFMQTALVGDSTPGIPFNDVYFANTDGNFFLDDPAKTRIDPNHPIREIRVSSGWIVDGVAVDYNDAQNNRTITMKHGSSFPGAAKVTLGAQENVISVFGRAGYQTYYKRNMVNSIGFVIFDQERATVRVVGPFGNSNSSNEGTPFSASNVMAFGGFAQETAQLGLSGLFFMKPANKQ